MDTPYLHVILHNLDASQSDATLKGKVCKAVDVVIPHLCYKASKQVRAVLLQW